MTQIIEFLSGKKSYFIGTLMIVLGIMNSDNNLILEGIAILTLRAGISKI